MPQAKARMSLFTLPVIALILGTIFVAIEYLSQPPTNLKPKVFVLGLSKTGTTSIGNALALLGYRRIGWKDIRSRHLVHAFIRGDIQPLIEQTRYFDAFEDLPWPFIYREMAEMFPDAKFVLSLRKDEQTWLRSMHRHQSRGIWEPAVHFYGTQDIVNKPEIALHAYRNHTVNVRSFFATRPDRYTEIVIDDDSNTNWKALCHVAQCPSAAIPVIAFPRSNTIEHWREDNWRGNLHWFWGWSISRVEEICVDLYFNRAGSPVRVMLEYIWHVVSAIELICCDWYFRLAVQGQTPPATA